MKVLLTLSFCAFASALFAADNDDSRRIIDGNRVPPGLVGVGEGLSLRTRELGMGGYEFTGRHVHFFASLLSSAGNCLDLGPGERPPKPPSHPEQILELTDAAERGRASLEAVNAWNAAGYPFHVSTAVRGQDGAATLRAVMHLEHGVTPATLADFIRRFSRETAVFGRHLKKFHS